MSKCPVQITWEFQSPWQWIPTVQKGTLKECRFGLPILPVLTLHSPSNLVLNLASQVYFSGGDGMDWPSDITSPICLEVTFLFVNESVNFLFHQPTSLGSVNQLPRAWSLWSIGCNWALGQIPLRLGKQNKITKIPKPRARPWTHPESAANLLLFLLDSYTVPWLSV